jgi:hypothetical protein
LGCTQNDEAILQVPFVQRPEQQFAFAVQTFPAVVHVGFGVMGAHFPPLQVPVQQAFPETGHAAPIETHCAAPHAPFTHAPLQQSVLTAQAALAGEHAPMGDAASPGFPTTPPSPAAPGPIPPSPLVEPPPSEDDRFAPAPPLAAPHASGAKPPTNGVNARAKRNLRSSMRVVPPGNPWWQEKRPEWSPGLPAACAGFVRKRPKARDIGALLPHAEQGARHRERIPDATYGLGGSTSV